MRNKTTVKSKDIEQDFLFHVIRSFITKTGFHDIPDNLNWERLNRFVVRHKLGQIFYYALDQETIPFKLHRHWRNQSIDTLVCFTRALKATVKLFTILENEGIPSVALRGIALAEWIYPEPSLRPMHDVDILIPGYEKNNLVKRLKKHGLTPFKILRSQYVYIVDGTLIEFHWSYLTPKRYRNLSVFDRWIENRRLLNTSEGNIYRLRSEDGLLDLICHVFIHHELDRILQLVDIGLFIFHQEIDWPYIEKWCEIASMTRLFCFTLSYVDYLFQLALKEKVSIFDPSYLSIDKELFKSYESILFKKDALDSFLIRKKHMLYVAENYSTKIKQIIRFISIDELFKLYSVLHCRQTWNE